MTQEEARPVRSRVPPGRRKPKEVSWAEMTKQQRRIVDAGETYAGEFPEGTAEEIAAWMMRHMVRKA
jgi:hypothetical protein